MTSSNFMVHWSSNREATRGRGADSPPAVLDSKKPGLFRSKWHVCLASSIKKSKYCCHPPFHPSPFFVDRWKIGSKLEKTVIFLGKSGTIVPTLPCKDRSPPLLHILDPNYPSLYLKRPRKCRKTYNFDIFQHFPKFAPLPLPILG